MGAKGSRIAQQIGEAGNTDVKVAKLLQGLTYTPTDSRPHQILPEENKIAKLCFALFSAEECKAFISLTKDLEFKKGSQSLGIPTATNVTLQSKLIADLIWERICMYVPERIGDQKVKGIDTRIRFVKYDATDAASTKPQNWLAIGKDVLNAVIFLNDDYEGGETVFHAEDDSSTLKNFSGGVLIVEDNVKTQMLPISTGTKYIMRVGIEIDGEKDEMANGMNETMHAVNIDDLLGAKVRRFTPALRQLSGMLPLTEEQEERPSPVIVEDFSLDRSECSRSPFADADEMARGSFALSMEDDFVSSVVIPDISDKKVEGLVTRCFSGRVDIDGYSMGKPSMNQYPSFKSMGGEEALSAETTAEIVPSARRVISQPTQISHGATEHTYPGFDVLT